MLSTGESKFLFAAELDVIMEMIDTNQDVDLISKALKIASNMEMNLERRIAMTRNIMYDEKQTNIVLKNKMIIYRL